MKNIQDIARKCGTSVFVVPKDLDYEIKNAIVLKPEEKSVITIEQVRELFERLKMKHTEDLFIIIRPAELLNLEASNALLKSLEEPGDKVHFMMMTDQPYRLLPTILSRASIYYLKKSSYNTSEITAREDIKTLAKRIIAAKSIDVLSIMNEMSKKKDNTRAYFLDTLSTAIEMSYRAYFITKNDSFLKKIPKLLSAYDNIYQNGNIKLQFVASLI